MGSGSSRLVPTIKQGNSSGSIPIRIMLIGKTGAGKSTLGNAILGKSAFMTEGHSMVSTTVEYAIGRGTIGDKNIVVLDTPGVMGTIQDEEQIMKELFKGAMPLHPGPHVFLLVIRADAKFTKEDKAAMEIFSNVFGAELYKHLIVVFTHRSALYKSNKTEDCLQILPETFQQFKDCCIAIEIGGKTKRVKKEVKELLQVVEMVIKRNKGSFYPGEKIKELGKKRMARIEDKPGLRATGREITKEIAGVLYDAVADSVVVLKNRATEKMLTEGEKALGWFY